MALMVKDLAASSVAVVALFMSLSAFGETGPVCEFAQRTIEARRAGLSAKADQRPPSVGSVKSSKFSLVVHWQEGIEPDYVADMLRIAESVWQAEVVDLGFLRPLPDGGTDGDDAFDVYLVTTLEPGVGGYAGFSGFYEATPRADAVGYLVIAGNLDPRLRRFVVAHEFFHASQMAYDWWEDISFMEGSATWMARGAFADDDIWWRYVPFFNAEPWKALDYISIKAPYQYGTALYSHYLDEHHGDSDASFVRALWEGTVQDGIDNEPDFLDVATERLGGPEAFAASYAEFGTWRVLTGPRKRWAKFSDAAQWADNVAPTIEATIEAGMQRVSGSASQLLQPWSHAYLSVRQSAGDTRAMTFSVAGDSATKFDVRWVQLGPDGETEGAVGIVQNGETLEFALPARPGMDEALVVVTNITDGTYDADTSPWEGRSFSWEFERR